MPSYYLKNAEETHQLGLEVAKGLRPNSILCFYGNLGAGKTTFIKGIASGLGIAQDLVNSPTFQYLNIYTGATPLYHFDLYRLKNSSDFLELGFEEVLSQGGISCIEWAERIQDSIPEGAIEITLSYAEDGGRNITISGIL